MDVIAGAVAFVEVLVAAQVEEVELVDQSVALEHVKGTVDGDAMDARVEFLRAIQDGAGIEVALGIVHDLEQDFSLAREAHSALGEGFLQAAGALVGVDSLAGGNSMYCGGHDSERVTVHVQRLILILSADRSASRPAAKAEFFIDPLRHA